MKRSFVYGTLETTGSTLCGTLGILADGPSELAVLMPSTRLSVGHRQVLTGGFHPNPQVPPWFRR